MFNKKQSKQKAPYTARIIKKYEKDIRGYIDKTHNETGMSKGMIFTNLVLKGIETTKAEHA